MGHRQKGSISPGRNGKIRRAETMTSVLTDSNSIPSLVARPSCLQIIASSSFFVSVAFSSNNLP